jgi:OOP family OmpA-OmpF porin
MTSRGLGLLVLLACAAGCGRPQGPFGFSHHPYSAKQLEKMLGDWPNPGPNVDAFVRDAAGNAVPPPMDRAAYAVELVIFEQGRPPAIIEGSNPREALGMPNYSSNIWEPPRAVSLGNGGAIVLRLTGDPLMDTPGPDLFVFESGPSREAVEVQISADGEAWIAVGEAPGGASAIDIAPFVQPGQTFRFVRLRDVPNSGGGDAGPWTGAEIDAFAAIRAKPVPIAEKPPERISIPTEVLFAFDSDTLGPGAPAELDRVAAMLATRGPHRLSIEGHTDDIGDDDYNRALSERRAQAVRTYLTSRGVDPARIEARGLGESRPAVANDSDDGRRKNRRVEIVIVETDR